MITQEKLEVRYAECPIIVTVGDDSIDIAHIDKTGSNEDTEANAKEIVKRWNCHADLLEACKYALRLAKLEQKAYLGLLAQFNQECKSEDSFNTIVKRIESAIATAEAELSPL